MFEVRRIELPSQVDLVQGVMVEYSRGTSPAAGQHTIATKWVVTPVPVPRSAPALTFAQATGLSYRALLYELHDRATGVVSTIVPNWFGVAIPEPNDFDITSDVYVVIYFHPTPQQSGAGYLDADYFAKTGSASGTNWKQLYAYVDRLGGQMAGAIQAGAPNNRLAIFPFLKTSPYDLSAQEWFAVIHDILQDIDSNIVNGICSCPKKIIVATLSNGSGYLNRFLDEAALRPENSSIIEAWDFDTAFSTPQVLVNPHGKRLRAYWQAAVPADTPTKTYVTLPPDRWVNFPSAAEAKLEVPPLPPWAPNSRSAKDPDPSMTKNHHCIRDMMFLDAVFNIEADNS